LKCKSYEGNKKTESKKKKRKQIKKKEKNSPPGPSPKPQPTYLPEPVFLLFSFLFFSPRRQVDPTCQNLLPRAEISPETESPQ
jgi:hypothetical protein